MIRTLWAALIVLLLGVPAFAQTFEDGSAAYRNGDGAAAFATWYPLAVDGDRDAQFNIGILYAYGLGIEADRIAGLDWLQKAADQGDVVAAYNLGVLLSDAESEHLNYSQAATFYERAVANDHPGAMGNLSILLANGLGVERNLSRAVRLSADSQDLECLVGETKHNFVPRLTRLTH